MLHCVWENSKKLQLDSKITIFFIYTHAYLEMTMALKLEHLFMFRSQKFIH